jgi:DNA-binding protein Fis
VQTKAAELLGISRRILKYKMDKYGIEGAQED